MKFNIDSPVFQFLGTLADFTLLNLVFLVSCIPVVTIGPAVCALFSVVLGEVRGEHGDMVRTYMRAVKENFRSSCFLALFYFITGALLLFHFAFWLQMNTWMGNAVLVLLTFCTALYVLSLMYAFALNARFENPIRRTLKNAVLLALKSKADRSPASYGGRHSASILCQPVFPYPSCTFRQFFSGILSGFSAHQGLQKI